MKSLLLLLAICSFTACASSKTATTNTPSAVTCPGLAGPIDLQGKDVAPEKHEPIKAAIIASCTEDKWSTEAMTCLAQAQDKIAGEKCFGLLSPQQKESFEKRAAAAEGPSADAPK